MVKIWIDGIIWLSLNGQGPEINPTTLIEWETENSTLGRRQLILASTWLVPEVIQPGRVIRWDDDVWVKL